MARKHFIPQPAPSDPNYTVISETASSPPVDAPPTNLPAISPVREMAYSASSILEGSLNNDTNVGGRYIQLTNSSMDGVHSATMPKLKRDQIRRAQEWRECDDLINLLVDIKLKFAVAGFNLQCSRLDSKATGDQPTELDAFQLKLSHFARKASLKKIVESLLQDYFTTDSMILYWRVRTEDFNSIFGTDGEVYEDAPVLLDICTINPGDCHYDDSMGVDTLAVDVPPVLKLRIQAALAKRTQEEKTAAIAELISEGVGQKWFEAVSKGKNVVKLDRKDGDNWLVRTKARKHQGLAKPSMSTVFKALSQRTSLADGEFSASQMMKHFIMMIQQGESIKNGQLAGDTRNWLKQADADALLKVFENVSKTMRMVTNHTMKVTFVFPPPEMFNVQKFDSCEGRIYSWAGVVVAIVKGSGGDYAGGFIGIKRLVAELISVRDDINWIMTEFFDNDVISDSMGVPDKCDVVALFDEQVLKEPKQLLDEIKFMVTNGILDPPGAAQELGRNPAAIKARKDAAIKENDFNQTWEPIYQPNQQSQDEGGRPPNPETTQNPATRTQTPAPSA